MVALQKSRWLPLISIAVTGLICTSGAAHPDTPSPEQTAIDSILAAKNEKFGIQLFSPLGGFVLRKGQPLPDLEWQDPEIVASLVDDPAIQTRWFDAQLNEVPTANTPGRYFAYGEAVGPSGIVFRRAMTCVLPDSRDLTALARKRNPAGADSLVASWRETEAGAIELSSILEQGNEAVEDRLGQWQMENATRHVKLKRKILGLDSAPSPVKARRIEGRPAPVLRTGTPTEADISREQLVAIENQLDAWFAAAKQPTSIVIARNGVIAVARSYGELDSQPVTIDTPMLLHSAMKPLIGCQLAMYVDRGLIDLDEPMGNHLVDFKSDLDQGLTFRAGQVHATGIQFPWPLAFSRHFYFETWHEGLIAHQPREWSPGEKHKYGIGGVILSVRAMELKSGMNYCDAMEQELFEPLGIRNILPGGTGFSAENLARMGVMLNNRGKYGEWELFSEATHDAILPTSLTPYFPDIDKVYGIGLQSYDSRLGPGSYGHGGGCGTQLIFYPAKNLVFSMVRNNPGDHYKKHLAETMTVLKSWVEN